MKAATWRDDSACLERREIVERNRGATGQQRLEAAAEIAVVGQRQRAVGQPVECMLAVDDAAAAGGAARELDRGFDGLGAGIGEEHLVEIGHVIEQALGQNAGQRRDVELHQIGQVGVEHALQGLAQHGMVATNGEYAESRSADRDSARRRGRYRYCPCPFWKPTS